MWHTAAIVLEPEGSPLPPQLQQSPLKAESPATFAVPSSGSGDVVGALPGLPPASPAHRGAAHTRNNSTSSALSEVFGWRVKDMSQLLISCGVVLLVWINPAVLLISTDLLLCCCAGFIGA